MTSQKHETSTTALHMDSLGIHSQCTVYHNLPYADIAAHESQFHEGVFTANGTFSVDTGKFTGRSPLDKFIVRQAPSDKHVDWGHVNQPTTAKVFDILYKKATEHLSSVDKLYVFDGYCGANESSRLNVRIVTELAWQHHFVTNMFRRPSDYADVAPPSAFAADFTILNACHVVDEDWAAHGLHSEVFVVFNIEKKVAVIGGTFYGGEMKKGIFSMMNYYLPLRGIMPMHASANKGKVEGDTALFFGLSGTGKTTLSADPKRLLIGDDEHGWDDEGIFNFEGGCYAKTIHLSAESEPEIHAAIRRDAMLENVWLDESGQPDYDNVTKTENGRVSYPLYHIANHDPSSRGTHPRVVIFLTCDAYGVLPPVSKLSHSQAQYHFLSGYTAKVAGTERGVTEPVATFSACFGAAFMTHHPIVYADLLKTKLETHETRVYLVNTGWTGGAYGVGQRMSLKYTRQCIDAILDGSIEDSEFVQDPIFHVLVPTTLGNIPTDLLNPALAWPDKAAYSETARQLATAFQDNFKQYVLPNHTDYSSFGPTV